MQKLLMLIVTASILYYLVQTRTEDMVQPATSNSNSKDSNAESSQLTGNFLEKTLSSVLINVLKTEDGKIFFENILQPMNKPFNDGKQHFKINNTDFIESMFQIKSFGEGDIGPASCGHIATIAYQITDLNGNLIEENTKTNHLGAKSIMPGLDAVIVGMMVGQSRSAVIPARYAYRNNINTKDGIGQNESYRVNVVLKDILPHNFVHKDEVKVFDDEISYQIPMICGDTTTFNARITKLSNGAILYDSKNQGQKITMTIGDVNYPLIFSFTLHNKIASGTRTVIAKGKTFKALGSNLNKIISQNSMPAEEYFMLELMDFSNEKKAN
jgi:FKBP-type peptidyl-prolyl cis-trans isomerase 2